MMEISRLRAKSSSRSEDSSTMILASLIGLSRKEKRRENRRYCIMNGQEEAILFFFRIQRPFPAADVCPSVRADHPDDSRKDSESCLQRWLQNFSRLDSCLFEKAQKFPDDKLYCGKCAYPFKPLEEISATKTLETPVRGLTKGTIFASRMMSIPELQ